MPLLWRYLLTQYLRVFLLSTFAFIAILLVMRLEEVAHFITLGADTLTVVEFVLYQIPYILPIAIPLSLLISTVLLLNRLSQFHELTALRACGYGLKQILTPLLMMASLIALLNFYLVSELSSLSHLNSARLKNQLRSINPLHLAHNRHLMRTQGFFFTVLGDSKTGESASNIVFALPSKNSNRLNLMVAKQIEFKSPYFTGENLTLISSLSSRSKSKSSLLIENVGRFATTFEDFSQLLQKQVWLLNNDHLKLSWLLVRIEDERQAASSAATVDQAKQHIRNFNRGWAEILRRFSIAFAAFSFTLMGAAFGMRIGRLKSSRGYLFIILLTTLFLLAYFAAQKMGHILATSILLYLSPHVLIIISSIWALKRVSRGFE